MKTLWYLMVSHIPIANGEAEGPPVVWAHGRNGSEIPLEDFTTDWLSRNGYRSKSAATRAAAKIPDRCDDEHWSSKTEVMAGAVKGPQLRYKIYRCYEIVIEDEEGYPIGESDYCYGSRKEAEVRAQHYLKQTKIKEGL